MTPEELLAAKQLAIQIRTALAAFDPSSDSLFASVGPSAEFLSTQLNASGVSAAELKTVIAKIDEAVRNDDVATINSILGIGQTILKSVKGLLAL